MVQFGIGQPAPRIEDPRLLTGTGNYTDDLRIANEAHGVVLRSPYAHAKIKSISTTTAKSLDGVLGVYTCLLYTSPSPRDATLSRMPSSA